MSVMWRLGRLPIPEHPSIWAPRMIREFGAELLPITLEHAVRVADLPDHHRDPSTASSSLRRRVLGRESRICR
jgi:PIN domain nuclease of toxin-antitoxin system